MCQLAGGGACASPMACQGLAAAKGCGHWVNGSGTRVHVRAPPPSAANYPSPPRPALTYERMQSQKVRHAASQDDKLGSYGWVRHDGRAFGRQQLVDGELNITMTMVGWVRWQRAGSAWQYMCMTGVASGWEATGRSGFEVRYSAFRKTLCSRSLCMCPAMPIVQSSPS